MKLYLYGHTPLGARLQRQSLFIANEEALMAIRNSEQRLYAIALIYQKLYQSENYTLVHMFEYINELIAIYRKAST